MASVRAEDVFWMRRAVKLAWRGAGLTRPNPPVGAVVVRQGKVVGEGLHRKAGGPHAEIVALREAGRGARGATLYVTLEPCSTWGKTPPCTAAILAAGIRRVIVSVRDPNPRHGGRGLSQLRRRGVKVTEGVCSKEGRSLIRAFSKWVTTGRPFVTLKLAMSLDGKIADIRGNSRWISGPESRRLVQAIRRCSDGILVGAGTVRQDDPSLLPRPDGRRRPLRIVVSGRGAIPADAKLLNDGRPEQTVVAVSKRCARTAIRRFMQKGVRVWVIRGSGGRVHPGSLLERLGREGLLHILCEGGSELAAELIRGGLVDEFVFFIAPCILGGGDAPGAVAGPGWLLESGPRLKFVSCERVGADLVVKAVGA